MSFSFRLKCLEKQSRYVHYDEEFAANKLATSLLSHLPETLSQPLVIVCIGTDRSTGDAFGPLVGSKIVEYNLPHFFVYGTLEEPVHALNLEQTIISIYNRYPNPFVIGIDACLGKVANIGAISVGNGPVRPGAAVNKKLPNVGDIHITGTVNMSGFMEYFMLQNTRLNLVIKMAHAAAESFQLLEQHLLFHVKQ